MIYEELTKFNGWINQSLIEHFSFFHFKFFVGLVNERVKAVVEVSVVDRLEDLFDHIDKLLGDHVVYPETENCHSLVCFP